MRHIDHRNINSNGLFPLFTSLPIQHRKRLEMGLGGSVRASAPSVAHYMTYEAICLPLQLLLNYSAAANKQHKSTFAHISPGWPCKSRSLSWQPSKASITTTHFPPLAASFFFFHTSTFHLFSHSPPHLGQKAWL